MKTLFGDKSEQCCGFCKLHRVGITPNQLKTRHCIHPTRCKHFRKFEDSEHWERMAIHAKRVADAKAESKQMRQKRKSEQKAYFEKLDKQREQLQNTQNKKLRDIHTESNNIIATYDTTIPTENPFAILATRQYANDTTQTDDAIAPKLPSS